MLKYTFAFLKLFFKALHFPDLFVKLLCASRCWKEKKKKSVLCSYVITIIMNGEFSPIKKEGNNMAVIVTYVTT